MLAPDGWTVCRIEDLGAVEGGRQRSRHIVAGRPRPYLRVANVFAGYISTKDVLTMPFTDDEFERHRLRFGDVLLNEGQSRELVGRSAVYRGVPDECAYQNTLIRFRPTACTNSDFAHHLFENLRRVGRFAAISSQTTSIAHLGVDRLATLRVVVPPHHEQVGIAAVLDAWNRACSAVENLIKARRKLKRGLMQQLLTGQRRFPDFRKQPWRECRLRDVAEECNEPGRGALGREHIMGVTKSSGIVPMEDRLIGNVDRYQVVRKEWYAYNPMRLNIGSIARWQKSEPVLVIPDYVVFRCRDGELDPAFLDQYRKGHLWESFMRVCGAGSVRVRIYFKDLGRHKIHLPPIEEQRRISSALETLDDELVQLRRLYDALKQQKKGLMQRLLTGKVRVPPSMLKRVASRGGG